MTSTGAERRSLPDSSSLRQRLLGQRRPPTANSSLDGDAVGSVDSDELEGQLNMILNDDRDTPKFRLRDLFNPKRLILFLWNSLHRATFGTICVIVLLWASIFVYASFYYIYIPALDVAHAIHFQFDTVCKESCTMPFANIQLSQYKQPTFFATGQQYRISVNLHVPESDINWDQGMFMLKIQLFDNNHNEIITSSRPAILRYKSPLLRVLYTVVYWPLLVTGLKTETQHLTIPLIENYVDGIKPKAGTATSATITLEGAFRVHSMRFPTFLTFPLAARTIQVYTSSMIVQANLTGLRYVEHAHDVATKPFESLFH